MSGLTSNPFLLIGGSFAFAVGLAWNDLITTAIKEYYTADNTLKARAIYCIILTMVIVMVTLVLNYLNVQSQKINQELATRHKVEQRAHLYG